MRNIDPKWFILALARYGLLDQEAHPFNEDGDVYIVSTPPGKKCFLKI